MPSLMLVGGSSKSALDAFLSDFSPLRPAGRATFSCRRAAPAALAGSGTASSAAFADSVRSESPALARRASTCSCGGVARAPSAPPSPGAEATALRTSSRRCWISCSNRSSMIARTSPGSLCTLASAPSSALSDAVAAWIAGRPNTVGALTIISRMRRFPSSSTEAPVPFSVCGASEGCSAAPSSAASSDTSPPASSARADDPLTNANRLSKDNGSSSKPDIPPLSRSDAPVDGFGRPSASIR